MKNRMDWDLILNYLDGDCSEDEEKQVLDWAAKSKKNNVELNLLKMVWTSPSLELPKPDVEKALLKVKQRINSLSYSDKITLSPVINIKKSIGSNNLINLVVSPRFLKIAVSLAIFIIGTFFISKMFINKTLSEIIVNNKMIKEIMLPDSTKVMLDAGSSLIYAVNFGEDNREIFLSGEGYFEVTHDKSKKFIVHTNSAVIKVLGTKFNVRAWEENNKEIVTVVEGAVKLVSDDSYNESSSVIIRNGQMSYVENGLVSSPEIINVNTQLSWMKREMIFNSTTLGEVLDQLSRWFDVEFTLPDDSYNKNIISVYIENKPIEDIVEMISLVMKFEYEINGNEIRFSLKE